MSRNWCYPCWIGCMISSSMGRCEPAVLPSMPCCVAQCLKDALLRANWSWEFGIVLFTTPSTFSCTCKFVDRLINFCTYCTTNGMELSTRMASLGARNCIFSLVTLGPSYKNVHCPYKSEILVKRLHCFRSIHVLGVGMEGRKGRVGALSPLLPGAVILEWKNRDDIIGRPHRGLIVVAGGKSFYRTCMY